MTSEAVTKPTTHICPPEARKYVLICAILASALGFIDLSVVAIAIPQIRESVGASFAQAQWVSNAYILFLSAFMLIGGAAGDRYGIRRTFLFGVGFFVIASQLCALAWDAQSLIAFRALQGVGASIMVPGSMALIDRNFPRQDRGRALGIWVAASSITTAMGPFLGGFLLSSGLEEVWRLVFAVNLPLGGIAMFLLWRKVPDDVPRERKKLDIVGAFLVTVSLGAIAIGLTLLGESKARSLPLIVFVGGLLLGVAALWWERRTPHAMIDLSLFASRTFSGGNLYTFVVWIGLGTAFFFLPIVMIVGWQLTEAYAGAVFLPFSATIALLSPIVGRRVDFYGPRPFLIAGALFAAISFGWMAWAVMAQNYWWGIVPSMIALGLAMGFSASPISVAVLSSVSDEQSGAASGINNMVSRLSGMIGIASLGALASLVYAHSIKASALVPDIQELMIEAGFGERLSGGLYQVSTQEVQVIAMNTSFAIVCCVLSTLGLVGAILAWKTIEPLELAEPIKAEN